VHLSEVPYRPVGPIIISKVSAHSLELEWRPPISDGGSPVVGYVIEMTESGSGAWVKVGYVSSRETKFTVAGLTEGGNYFFRVFAESRAGLSRPLQSDCITPSAPIGKRQLMMLEFFGSQIPETFQIVLMIFIP